MRGKSMPPKAVKGGGVKRLGRGVGIVGSGGLSRALSMRVPCGEWGFLYISVDETM